MTKNLCFCEPCLSGGVPTFPLKLAQKHFYLFYKVRILIHIPYIKVIPEYLLKLSYFLHKHQMKATKISQAYKVGTHGCV